MQYISSAYARFFSNSILVKTDRPDTEVSYVASYPSLALSDQFALTSPHLSSPRLVFPLLVQEFAGRLLENKIKLWTH